MNGLIFFEADRMSAWVNISTENNFIDIKVLALVQDLLYSQNYESKPRAVDSPTKPIVTH